MGSHAELILASGSRARGDLLRAAGYTFRQIPSGVPEPPPDRDARFDLYLRRLARAKASAVAARHPSAYVIGADTALWLDGRVLGKPRHAADAFSMLRRLAGRSHRITTAVCVMAPARGGPGRCFMGSATAHVVIRSLSYAEIRSYVAAVRPFHCAGAYAVQDGGAAVVAGIRGDFGTVIGLPMGVTIRLLKQAGYRNRG